MTRRVVVDGKMTYLAELNIAVGDAVWCRPTGYHKPRPWIGLVTSFDTTYDGPCKPLMGKATEDEQHWMVVALKDEQIDRGPSPPSVRF